MCYHSNIDTNAPPMLKGVQIGKEGCKLAKGGAKLLVTIL